jgi:hypothetical protein
MNDKSKRGAKRVEEAHIRRQSETACINCDKPGAHFVPPSLGEEGFFACEVFEDRKKETLNDT